MKIQPAKFGPFRNHIRFDVGEIDSLMEEHYYGYWNGKFDFETPGLDMERFVETYLASRNVEFDPKASESELGSGVLGKTIFNPDGLKIIQIKKSLYEKRTEIKYRGRYNFTAAHESFHALMHEALFDLSGKQLELDMQKRGEAATACLNRHVFDHEKESTQPAVKKTPWQEV